MAQTKRELQIQRIREGRDTLAAYSTAWGTYEDLNDGRWYGEIPTCPGVWAIGASREECERELVDVLEGWLIVKMKNGDTDIPPMAIQEECHDAKE